MTSFRDLVRRLIGGDERHAQQLPEAELPFGVGDRVADTWGNQAIVTQIDVAAEHGLGKIGLRYDDGRELSCGVVAHDLTRVDSIKK